MSKTEDLKRSIFAIADPDKVSPFNGDMVTLFLHEIEKLVESAIAGEQEAMLDRIRPMIVQAEERGAKEEREACANLCETASFPHQGETQSDAQWGALTLAVAIRARGTK